jgi:hypothetical protein
MSEQPQRRLAGAYARMLERLRGGMEGGGPLPQLQELIAGAREKAVEVGELTREEAERVGDYVRRDLVDAARFLADEGEELRTWLRFDLELIEARLLDVFSLMVDHTRQELQLLQEQAGGEEQWRSGEVASIGTLRCLECGQEVALHEPAEVPACPRCGGTAFTRGGDEASGSED